MVSTRSKIYLTLSHQVLNPFQIAFLRRISAPSSSRRMFSKPLIVICGTTGVGKSKLGIELALALQSSTAHHNHPYRGARIINADSMQVYVGMDVITNKVPAEERCGVEHLLMDYKKPGEQLTGPEWIRDAIQSVRFSSIYVVVTDGLRGRGGTQDRGDARAE